MYANQSCSRGNPSREDHQHLTMSSFAIAVLLAWVAGFVDAVGYVALSKVFVAHMSGNTVAAASHLGAGTLSQVFRRGLPIPLFVIGVFCGALLGRAMQWKQFRRRFAPSFVLEALLLCVFAGLSVTSKISGAISDGRMCLLVALLTMAMGLQNATLRCARGMAVRTTFISGMLVNMAERTASYVARAFGLWRTARRGEVPDSRRLSRCRNEGKLAMKYALLWLGMFVGAISGAGWKHCAGRLSCCSPSWRFSR